MTAPATTLSAAGTDGRRGLIALALLKLIDFFGIDADRVGVLRLHLCIGTLGGDLFRLIFGACCRNNLLFDHRCLFGKLYRTLVTDKLKYVQDIFTAY